MANDFTVVIPQILAQSLQALREMAYMPLIVNRGYEREAGAKGSTVEVSVPSVHTVHSVTPGPTPDTHDDVVPTVVNLVMDQWKEVALVLTDKEELEIRDGVLPAQMTEAVRAIANSINGSILDRYVDFYGVAGTPGTTPFATDVTAATAARKVLSDQLCPDEQRYLIIDTAAEANALNLNHFSNTQFGATAEAIGNGKLTRKLGFDWMYHNGIRTHTAGVPGGTPLVNGIHAVGVKSISIDGGGASGTYAKGDIVVFSGHTQTYVVTAAVTLNGSGVGALPIEPALKSALADNATITLKAGGVQNLAINRNAIAFASRPLKRSGIPGSLVEVMTDPASGISLRLEVQRQHKRDRWSLDALWGVQTIRRELGCRLYG